MHYQHPLYEIYDAPNAIEFRDCSGILYPPAMIKDVETTPNDNIFMVFIF